MARRPSKFVRSAEVSSALSQKGRQLFYAHLAQSKVNGATRNPSGWGWVIPRKGFLAWIEQHQECRAVQPEPQVESEKELSEVAVQQSP